MLPLKGGAIVFSIVRGSRKTLVEQVVDGLRQCISTGVYGPGDVLPATRELAVSLGVSRIVTRSAVRELAEAGLVNPRPGVGCVVLGSKGKLWRGTILFIAHGNIGNYYAHAFSDEMASVFVRNGWRLIRVSVTKTDTSLLELELAHPVDLAVLMFGNPAAERVLSKSGVPFVAIGSAKTAKQKTCIAAIPVLRDAAAGAVVARARAAGVGNAWQVGFEPQVDIVRAFAKAGIPIREILVKPQKGKGQPEATVFAAQEHFEKLLAKDASTLPDLLYFSDDYVCQGALLALLRHGIESPRDVKVVTWANRGNGPYYTRPLARVELSPREDGRRLTEKLLDWLSSRKPFAEEPIVPVYADGETI